jgi:hypothetical protein
MTIAEFVQEFQTKKIMNTKIEPNAVANYIKKTLEIKTYLPFEQKRAIAETIVKENTEIIDGVKKNNSINQYLSFVMSMIIGHTNLTVSDNPAEDYDLLAESGLLSAIIAEFQESYNETDVLVKMTLASELEYNNVGFILGRFLDGILNKLESAAEVIKKTTDNVNDEDLAKLRGFLNTYIK